MKEMALVAALAVFASLASVLAEEELPTGPETLKVQCDKKGAVTSTGDVKITVKDTTLTLTCPDTYTAQPAPEVPATNQKVFSTDACDSMLELKTYCSGATGKIVDKNSVLQLSFPTVPSRLADFYLKCNPGSSRNADKPCTVHVLVQTTATPGGHGSSDGQGSQQQGSGQAAGPAGVQTCVHKDKSITVRVPQKGSLAQFACESGFTLYPTKPDKVFSKDCKTEETLKDMTRSQTTGATSVRGDTAAPTYTLTASKKPAKKTLCYLCATTGTTPEAHGTAKDYCTIYVESGAGTQFDLSFILALALPCVPAVFQFT